MATVPGGDAVWRGADRKSRFWLAYLRGWEHPGKVRFFHAFARRLFPSGLLVRNSRGTLMKARPGDYIGWAICRLGVWEPQTLALAARLLDRGGLFVDVGANAGVFSCCLGSLPGVRCCALEPFPSNFEALRQNLALNPSIRGSAFNVAAGAGTGSVQLEDRQSGNSGMVRVARDDASTAGIRCMASMRPIKDLLDDIGEERPVLMKIDVEGYELAVLEGVDWSPHRRPRNLIVEYTDNRSSLVAFLEGKGYQSRTVLGAPLSTTEAVPEENAWFRLEA